MRSAPSRTTRARGATSSAARSSTRLARSSWMIPIEAFATRMPANRPSAYWPLTRISTRKTARIRLNSVSVFDRTMLLTERLEGGGGTSPRCARRRAASCSLRPAAAASGSCDSSITEVSVVCSP